MSWDLEDKVLRYSRGVEIYRFLGYLVLMMGRENIKESFSGLC